MSGSAQGRVSTVGHLGREYPRHCPPKSCLPRSGPGFLVPLEGLGRLAGFSLSFRGTQGDRRGRKGSSLPSVLPVPQPQASSDPAQLAPLGLRHQTRGWEVQSSKRCLGRVGTGPQPGALSAAPNCRRKHACLTQPGTRKPWAEGYN